MVIKEIKEVGSIFGQMIMCCFRIMWHPEKNNLLTFMRGDNEWEDI